jgi:hypothetical protein
MIVVTGSARTGTSLMMQTLINLGYESVAPAFVDEHKDIIDHNKKGFYELNLDMMLAVSDKDKGKAIKVFPSCFDIIDFDLVDKIIVMNRNREDSIRSYEPVLSKLGMGKDIAPQVYDLSYERISQINNEIPIIFVNFEDITETPEKAINSLVDELNISVTDSMLENSINNIKK